VATSPEPPSGEDTTNSGDAFKAEPERGGCFQLGWGCLPVVVAGFGLLPLMMF
jgi:hypothetical protein